MGGYQGASTYTCKICGLDHLDRDELAKHLKTEHEPLEIVSFAAVTMADEQERDAAALEFNRRFQGLKRIIGE